MLSLQDTIQTGVGSEGYSLTFDSCKYIAMCQFHKLHPRSFTAVGFGHSVIGDTKPTYLPPLATFIPSGVEVLNLVDGIIAARLLLFDSSSFLVARDLERMELRLEKANRPTDATWQFCVLASWTALKSSFQTYSQAVNSSARSPQALNESSLMAKSTSPPTPTSSGRKHTRAHC
jgi:hypothetical protein